MPPAFSPLLAIQASRSNGLRSTSQTAGTSSDGFQNKTAIRTRTTPTPSSSTIPRGSSSGSSTSTPTPMAAPAPHRRTPTSLVNLPDDILLSIIPCKADRGRVSLVGKAWRAAMDRLKAPAAPRLRPLPWLLLPAPYPDGSTRVACVLSGCRVHHYLAITPPGARCFGSHDGAWLFLDYTQTRSHQILNVRTRDVRVLPAELLRRNDPNIYNMVILAAALSSSPDDSNCVAAAIVLAWQDPAPDAVDPFPLIHRCAAFWRMGEPRARAIEIPPDANQAVYNFEDVVYHDGAFRFLLTHGDILVSDQTEILMTNWELLRFHPVGRSYDDPYWMYVRARYLVVSRGKLLLVVRFTPHPNQFQPRTLTFMVFVATERDTDADADADANFPVAEYPCSWSELETLGGRMLFVGYGCSRSYEVDQYPGFKDGIYFLDEREFPNEEMIFGNGNVRQYPCSDNGKWSKEDHVRRCFPRPDPSDYSAPAWLLP